jgi:hypothetical protein
MTTQKHPLIGKILRWESEDGESFQVSQFVEALGDGYFLLERLCPRHRHTQATALGVQHVRTLDQLVAEEGADIFDNWDAFLRYWLASETTDDSEGEAERPPSPLH